MKNDDVGGTIEIGSDSSVDMARSLQKNVFSAVAKDRLGVEARKKVLEDDPEQGGSTVLERRSLCPDVTDNPRLNPEELKVCKFAKSYTISRS